ncbi:hypothetical protein POM88_052806 [Heracleum sosnowskyi]|uniref:Uncharacterized protein n=1 Tax=Heracleum sosnowskyi TaxID=360622 RepID=A0AAD8LYD9_9APIA|nr:hypothetical protein POM88_052806 [Heracleum sosnowskyi]
MYGWSARADDYGSPGVVGDFLRKIGELKTVSNIVEEEDRGKRDKRQKLQFELDKKNENMDDLKMKYEKERLHQDFIKETKRMHTKSQEHIRSVFAAQGHIIAKSFDIKHIHRYEANTQSERTRKSQRHKLYTL